jgi:hypothetical protein
MTGDNGQQINESCIDYTIFMRPFHEMNNMNVQWEKVVSVCPSAYSHASTSKLL